MPVKEVKGLHIRICPKLRARVKKHAIDRETSVQELITQLLTNELKPKGNDHATEHALPE